MYRSHCGLETSSHLAPPCEVSPYKQSSRPSRAASISARVGVKISFSMNFSTRCANKSPRPNNSASTLTNSSRSRPWCRLLNTSSTLSQTSHTSGYQPSTAEFNNQYSFLFIDLKDPVARWVSYLLITSHQ